MRHIWSWRRRPEIVARRWNTEVYDSMADEIVTAISRCYLCYYLAGARTAAPVTPMPSIIAVLLTLVTIIVIIVTIVTIIVTILVPVFVAVVSAAAVWRLGVTVAVSPVPVLAPLPVPGLMVISIFIVPELMGSGPGVPVVVPLLVPLPALPLPPPAAPAAAISPPTSSSVFAA